MVAILKLIGLCALAALAIGSPGYKYIAHFVACYNDDCHGESITEQYAPWKFAEYDVCKTYKNHSFPGFQYKWSGTPNGGSCADCPDSFGHCTMRVFEGKKCTGRVMVEIPDANTIHKDQFSNGYSVGGRAHSVRVECEGDYQWRDW